MKYLTTILAFVLLVIPLAASAATSVEILPTKMSFQTRNLDEIYVEPVSQIVQSNFNISLFRQVRAQVIMDNVGRADHILVYLSEIGTHRMATSAIGVDANFNVLGVKNNYQLTPYDVQQQLVGSVQCPDPSVQFIAFAPNDDALEQQITTDVGNYASAHGLKTVMLLKNNATSQNYLNYMSCPNLVGNFYDGDANPEEIATVDGAIEYHQFAGYLKGAFRFNVTNIWLACEAYNDPMLDTMINQVQSQKYAAGVNDLEVGPSDKTGACAMEAAISGQSMTTAFQTCYKQYDNSADHWGFGGNGADYFGKSTK